MSRVHDALRRAAQQTPEVTRTPSPRIQKPPVQNPPEPVESSSFAPTADGAAAVLVDTYAEGPRLAELEQLEEIIAAARQIPFTPLAEALMVNPAKPREAPGEEFRTLRTRLNHLQNLQPLHTLVVTSASPAEGKSFTATNLAVTQAQLAEKRVLLADFDFRRPNIEKTFQIDVSPGITDYLLGKASLRDAIRRIEDSNLYLLTAGASVPNPLELLNLKECNALIHALRDHFDWVILDSPPLLFAADGNLLATMCDGTILVVRIGATTVDSVSRAIQSLCENNVLGVVVNGARRGELYSKYTYYYNYEDRGQTESAESAEATADAEEVAVAEQE